MKKRFVFLIMLCTFYATAFSQKLQYSRDQIKDPVGDALQLVTNVGGFHHLVSYETKRKPAIYVFNAQLQFVTKKELGVTLNENCDINITAFKNHYIIYFHVPGRSIHQLFRVNSDGSVKDISMLISKPADALWNRSIATFQLFNIKEELFILSHTYYDAIKKISSIVVKLNSESRPVVINEFLLPFDRDEEELKQVSLDGDHLLILKTSKNAENGNSLGLFKINLSTKHTMSKYFESGKHVYMSPTFHFNLQDSSVIVYSMLTEPVGYIKKEPAVLISRLGDSLQELAPTTILRSQFKDKASSNFMLINESGETWINLAITNNYRRTGDNLVINDPDVAASYANNYIKPTDIRFSLLNKDLKLINDSLVKNNGNYYSIDLSPFAQFRLKSIPYLLLIQNFTSNKKGLLLIRPGDNGTMVTSDINVNYRYNFLLRQLRVGEDQYFIMPYKYKGEIGLLKVNMK